MLFLFVKTKGYNDLILKIRGDRWPAMGFHSDKSQRSYVWFFIYFKLGNNPFLIIIDIDSRNLEVEEIKFIYWILNPQRIMSLYLEDMLLFLT